jgi:hypothetical protein
MKRTNPDCNDAADKKDRASLRPSGYLIQLLLEAL